LVHEYNRKKPGLTRQKKYPAKDASPAAGPRALLKDIHLPGWAYGVSLAVVMAIVAFIRLNH